MTEHHGTGSIDAGTQWGTFALESADCEGSGQNLVSAFAKLVNNELSQVW
jgi:hypothetical protein